MNEYVELLVLRKNCSFFKPVAVHSPNSVSDERDFARWQLALFGVLKVLKFLKELNP